MRPLSDGAFRKKRTPDIRSVSDGAVFNVGILAYHTVFSDHGPALQNHPRINYGAGSDDDLRINVRRTDIHKSHTVLQMSDVDGEALLLLNFIFLVSHSRSPYLLFPFSGSSRISATL